jgi:hypothetical protein
MTAVESHADFISSRVGALMALRGTGMSIPSSGKVVCAVRTPSYALTFVKEGIRIAP